jgi:hypothetical protein
MKLYKDGQEVLVDKPQMKILLEAGWSMSKDGDQLEVPASEETTEVDDIKDVGITSVVKPKKLRKPKKISVKE